MPATPIIVRPAERCRDIEFAVLRASEGSGKRRVQSGSEPEGVAELKLSRCRACKCARKHADSVRAKRLALPRLATSPWSCRAPPRARPRRRRRHRARPRRQRPPARPQRRRRPPRKSSRSRLFARIRLPPEVVTHAASALACSRRRPDSVRTAACGMLDAAWVRYVRITAWRNVPPKWLPTSPVQPNASATRRSPPWTWRPSPPSRKRARGPCSPGSCLPRLSARAARVLSCRRSAAMTACRRRGQAADGHSTA